MTVNVEGGTLPRKEIQAYIDYIQNKSALLKAGRSTYIRTF